MKTEMGFDQLLPLTLFNDESKGYLIDDCCLFGAEIFVIKHTSNGECLSLVKQPVHSTFTWNIQNFSALDRESCKSQVFDAGGHKWYVKFKEMLCNQAGGQMNQTTAYIENSPMYHTPQKSPFTSKVSLMRANVLVESTNEGGNESG
ncbi:hypothetical protein NC651_035754 [Populus alba x Populus x berolinensis]|nr:hypothetical protein NC651_035754 [Populus alba x Populus x berolinensis]